MKKVILTLALGLLIAVGANAQEVKAECCTSDKPVNAKGDWYVGTGNIANVAWTDWAVSPTVGYGISDKLMVGLGVSQADSSEDLSVDISARYFMNVAGQDFFLYTTIPSFETDNLSLGLGKMFVIHKSVFIEPKLVYHTGEKTTNMMLGFGLKF